MVETILPFELNDVVVKKRGKTLIGPLTWNSGDRGVTIILGPNGSGKTTLLRAMHGLERPRQGSVKWNCETSLAQKHQAFVFQSPIMLRRTALENIVFALRLQGKSKPEAEVVASGWLERIGLAKVASLNATFLSGGERQKLALARALACGPQVLFLDEPTSNLDGVATREIEAVLREAMATGLRVIMATHDIGQAKRLAGDVIFLYKGRLHEEGSASDFFVNPQTQEAKAYLQGDIVE